MEVQFVWDKASQGYVPIPAHPASCSGRIRPLIPEYPAKGATAPLVA